MAFKRTQTPTFSTPVTVNVPNNKGGFDKSTFTAIFRRPSMAELDEIRGLKNDEVVRRTMVGWDLRDGDTHESVEFSEVEMEAVLQISPTPMATATAFWESVSGARSKNL